MILAESVPDSEFQWLTVHLGHSGVYIALIFSALFVFTRVVEGSEKVAKYIPLIGKKILARRDRKEAARRQLAREEAEAAIAQLEPPNYADKVASLERRIDILERKDDVAHDYRVYDAEWHRSDEMKRAEDGWPIIPHLTWDEFAAKWHSGQRYENGKWFKP